MNKDSVNLENGEAKFFIKKEGSISKSNKHTAYECIISERVFLKLNQFHQFMAGNGDVITICCEMYHFASTIAQ